MDKSYFSYWGKAEKKDQKNQTVAYHLLPYHCLDVAACGYWLVKLNRLHAQRIISQLGFSIEEGAFWFAWLLSLHDIGKFARSFQQLVPEVGLLPYVKNSRYDARHDSLGFWLWKVKLKTRCKGFKPLFSAADVKTDEDLLDALFALTSGHHGKPPLHQVKGAGAFEPEDIDSAQMWIDEVSQLFGIEHQPAHFADEQWFDEQFTRASWPLAGLIVLADWLGSNQVHFAYCAKPMPLSDYWQLALTNAKVAIEQLPVSSLPSSFKQISDLFDFIQQPTPLQALAANLPLNQNSPDLLILEDVTGAGKTEAALILTHRLMSEKKGDGLYIGLPTTATANAMFSRMQKAYRALFQTEHNPSLILAHGARQLNTAFTHSVWHNQPQQGGTHYTANEQTASTGCNAWFADSRKKALLADVGVGTLDQALLAVLPVHHQSLRMLGLQGKIVVLDEVHAYDAYMNKLLESLLCYHAQQGGSAIILSATLSQVQRQSLLNAFAKGCQQRAPQLTENPAYPLLTHYAGQQLNEEPVETRPEVCREVAIRWLHDEEACLTAIRQAVNAGRCIAWIRNSVDDAIRIYQALQHEFDSAQLTLFHSRFAFVDRLNIEDQINTTFGKHSQAKQRTGKLVIATQVIEQSMDLDFDLMISDLAPVDLLIQRAGRLQRHIRDASGSPANGICDGRAAPELLILAPEWSEQPEADWLSAAMRNTSYVYPDHAKLWLSQSILRQQGMIKMPESARLLVEAVYGEQAIIPEALQPKNDQETGKKLSTEALAVQLALETAEGYHHDSSSWHEDIEISTRLGEETITLVLVYQQHETYQPYANTPFAWEMSQLKIRKTLWQKINATTPHLAEDILKTVQTEHHLPFCEVVVLPEGECTFYSKTLGLITTQ